MRKTIKTIAMVVVGLIALGLSFYGGRVYQNNADQKLFTAYNPPTQSPNGAAFGNRGASFGGAGGGSGGASLGGGSSNAQVQAALAVGTPPQPTSEAGSGAISTGQGVSSAGASGRLGLVGQLVSATNGTLTLQSFQGQQSVATTARTAYYTVAAASAHSLAVGQQVAVTLVRGSSSTAQSVTIVPSGSPFIAVRSFGFGGSGGGSAGGSSAATPGRTGGGFGAPGGSSSGSGGGFGAPGGSSGSASSGGSGGFAGSAGGFSGARTRQLPITGTITALRDGSLTLKTAQGASRTVTLSSAAVYRATKATSAQLKKGAFVSVQPDTASGQNVAADVAQATASGIMVTFAS